MDSKTKTKIKGRLLTLISKIEELKSIGYETGTTGVLPELESMEQDCVRSYEEIDCA